jgi:two-component system, NtrC family, response regulator HydG
LEQAGTGFLFLHNVSELPKWMQARVFHVIQSGCFCRLGSNQSLPLTARIAASATEDLAVLAASGKFFHELYYYLHVVPVHVPSLHQRRDDICPLADQFLEDSLRLRPAGKPIHRLAFSKDAHRLLEAYAWPGNVYELSNLVRRAVVFASGSEISASELAELFPPPAAQDPGETITIPYAGDLKIIERSIVSEVINRYNGNKSAAARALGLHRKTLYRILEDERTGPADAPLVQG